MLRVILSVLLVANLAISSATSAQTVPPTSPRVNPIPSSAFAERTGLSALKLSPDGTMVAMKSLDAQGIARLVIITAADRKVHYSMPVPDGTEFNWLDWAGNGRVLLSLSQRDKVLQVDVWVSRLFVYDLASKKLGYVGKKHMGLNGDEVLHVDPAGQFVTMAVDSSNFGYVSLWRFPLDGTAPKKFDLIEDNLGATFQWFADNAGTPRLAFGFVSGGAYKAYYRSSDKESWRTVGSFTRDQFDKLTLQDITIQAGTDLGYVLADDGSGKLALRRFDFRTFTPGEVLNSRPGIDAASLEVDDAFNPVGLTYIEDSDDVVWLDPQRKALHARLSKALGNNDVRITALAKDGSRALVWATRPNDPGVWYIYNGKEKRLDLLAAEKPRLSPDQLAMPRPVSYTARDGTPIRAYLTLPPGRPAQNLPLIILPHGGPYGVRDKLRFDNEAQFLASRGYAVLQPNFRGSGGYGDAFLKLGDGTIGRAMQDDLDDGMDWTVAQGIVDRSKVCVVGSSYGGYAALWAVTRNPERYRCAASFAGVTDWNALLAYDSKFLSRFDARQLRKQLRGDGGFNFDTVSPAKHTERLKRPILLAHGEKDYVVPFDQFKQMRGAARRDGVTFEELVFPDEGHGFNKAANEQKWFDTLEAFLMKHNPA